MARILMPIPCRDFDPTEAAISWLVLTEAGHAIAFATPDGQPAQADALMISGRGLDPWGFIPLLRNLTLVGRLLRANRDGREAYARMARSEAFRHPVRWSEIRPELYDALVLPGGHRARGMREYLESEELRQKVLPFFREDKPIAAVCHGVLLAARTIDPATGRSVLYGRRTTALTWKLERAAAITGRIVRFWDPNYYRTYVEGPEQPVGYMSVQQEVTRALQDPADFLDVLATSPHIRVQTDGLHRDARHDPRPAFVVRDGHYVSARWPGDVFTFAQTFARVLAEREGAGAAAG